MYVIYVLFYPLCALALAMLATYFFPFPVPEPLARSDQFIYFLYRFVDYLLALFMLLFCFLLLRRIVKRSLAYLIQLPLPLREWARLKHLLPVAFSIGVLSYLFLHMFIHTLIAFSLAVLWEWLSMHTKMADAEAMGK